MATKHRVGGAVAVATLLAICANGAWPAPAGLDPFVERSEVIVVGHVKPGSIRHAILGQPAVPGHPRPEETYTSATLLIAEAIKGADGVRELPIILNHRFEATEERLSNGSTTARIIYGNQSDFHHTDDYQDCIWLLRRLNIAEGIKEDPSAPLGIAVMQDAQPLRWKAYFQACCEPDPEIAMRRLVVEQSEAAPYAQSFLDRIEIERAGVIADQAARAERLIPIFARYAGGEDVNDECRARMAAREALIGCGTEAGERLIPLYREIDPVTSPYGEVLEIWVKISFKGAIPVVIEDIDEINARLANEHLAPEWFNERNSPADLAEVVRRMFPAPGMNASAAEAQARRIMGRPYLADPRYVAIRRLQNDINLLGALGDASARDVIIGTLAQWEDTPSIAERLGESCRNALAKIEKAHIFPSAAPQ